MKREELVEYLLSQDCHFDESLETDEFSVVVNSITLRAAQLVKDDFISAHTAVVLFRALNIQCHQSLEDFDAVLQAHEHSKLTKPKVYPDRLN